MKALDPDGMPPIFYQHYWQRIGAEVTKAVLDCLNTRKIPTSLNHTYITLIPKVKSPEKVSNFRTIALCNVLYKIISNVLANRLKKILPQIISESLKVPFKLTKPSQIIYLWPLKLYTTRKKKKKEIKDS